MVEDKGIVEELKELLVDVFKIWMDKDLVGIGKRGESDRRKYNRYGMNKKIYDVEIGGNGGWMLINVNKECSGEEFDKLNRLGSMDEDEVWNVGYWNGYSLGVSSLCCCWGGIGEYGGNIGLDWSDVGWWVKKYNSKEWKVVKKIEKGGEGWRLGYRVKE